MSLVSEIIEELGASPEVTICAVDRQRQFGSFVTVNIIVATVNPVGVKELKDLQETLMTVEPRRVFDLSQLVEPWIELFFEEKIGEETITQTFTVDDAVSFGGLSYREGEQAPITRSLTRSINVRLYPSTAVVPRQYRCRTAV